VDAGTETGSHRYRNGGCRYRNGGCRYRNGVTGTKTEEELVFSRNYPTFVKQTA